MDFRELGEPEGVGKTGVGRPGVEGNTPSCVFCLSSLSLLSSPSSPSLCRNICDILKVKWY